MDKVRISRIEKQRRRRIRRAKTYTARGIFLLMAGLLVFFMARGITHAVQLLAREPEQQMNENVQAETDAEPGSDSPKGIRESLW